MTIEWQNRQEDEEDAGEEDCCGLNDSGAALYHFIEGGVSWRNLAMVHVWGMEIVKNLAKTPTPGMPNCLS